MQRVHKRYTIGHGMQWLENKCLKRHLKGSVMKKRWETLMYMNSQGSIAKVTCA